MQRTKEIRAGRLVYAVMYTQVAANDTPRARAAKQKATTAARRAINLRYSWQKLEQLIAANFDAGDLIVTLTYDDEHLPPDKDGARKCVKKFLAALRAHRKHRGLELKYIYNIENLHDEGRYHHHMILNRTSEDLEIIRSLWSYGENSRLDYLDPMRYEDLARYMTKEAREEGRNEVGTRSWSASLNLERPQTVSDTMPDNVTLAPPPGAVVLASEGPTRNEFGSFAFIKYLLPSRPASSGKQKKRHRPSQSRRKT